MGLFDRIYVECPHCHRQVEFQSKAAEDPYMRTFTLEDAPTEILMDVMNHPQHCEGCDGWLVLVDPNFPPGLAPRPELMAEKVREPEHPRTHAQGYKWWPDDKAFSFGDLIN